MKPLLAVSLFLNLVLAGIFCFRWAAPATPVPSAPQEVKAPVIRLARRAPAPRPTPVNQTPQGAWTGTIQHLYAQLRAAGAPREVVLALLFAHGGAERRQRMLELQFPHGVNRWSSPQSMTADMREELTALSAEHEAELRRVIGPEFARMLFEADTAKALKWGALSDQSLAAATKLTTAYTAALNKNHSLSGMAAAAELDEAYEKDIRASLSAAEADDFLAFNSGRALALQKALSTANITVDEDTYRTLYRAGVAIGASFQGPVSGEVAKLYDAVLGGEQALLLVGMQDGVFRRIDGFVSGTGQDASTRVSIYRDYQDMLSRVAALQRADRAGSSGSKAQIAEAMRRFYNHLADRVPPGQLDAFRQSPQGSFLNRYRGGGN